MTTRPCRRPTPARSHPLRRRPSDQQAAAGFADPVRGVSGGRFEAGWDALMRGWKRRARQTESAAIDRRRAAAARCTPSRRGRRLPPMPAELDAVLRAAATRRHRSPHLETFQWCRGRTRLAVFELHQHLADGERGASDARGRSWTSCRPAGIPARAVRSPSTTTRRNGAAPTFAGSLDCRDRARLGRRRPPTRSRAARGGAVLDLRGNGGGAFSAVLSVAGSLLPPAPVGAAPPLVALTREARGAGDPARGGVGAGLLSGRPEVMDSGRRRRRVRCSWARCRTTVERGSRRRGPPPTARASAPSRDDLALLFMYV